jgi:hypothetical protein
MYKQLGSVWKKIFKLAFPGKPANKAQSTPMSNTPEREPTAA